MTTLRHATCIDIDGQGVLLRGRSGSGKSDLAVRLMDDGARLVADDQVALELRDGDIWASPPKALAGKMELRGIGIVSVDYCPATPVRLVCDLVPRAKVTRLPERVLETLLPGAPVPVVRLHAFDASASIKIRMALHTISW